MISERSLKQWRRDALKHISEGADLSPDPIISHNKKIVMLNRILRLTQELMDLYLIRK